MGDHLQHERPSSFRSRLRRRPGDPVRLSERVARVLTALLILAGSAVVLVPEAPAAVTIGGVPNSLGLPFQSVGTVRASAVAGEWTYIGGSFLTVDGRTATRLARVSTATGEPDPSFDVAIGSPTSTTDVVNALAVDPATGVLYVGGSFTVAGGLSRSNVAAVDTATGQVISSWVANANSVVYALVVDGAGVYVGGAFTAVTTTAVTPRSRAMRLSTWTAATPTVTVAAWHPSLNGAVWAIAADPARGQVLLGGDFSTVGSTSRVRLAAVDAEGGAATAWYPSGGIAQSVRAIATIGDQVLLGTAAGGVLRTATLTNNDAAGSPLPSPSGTINAIAVDQGAGVAYLGGSQTVAGRSRLVAVDTTTFAVKDWTPAPDAEVFTVAVTGDSVFAGGSFLNVADTARDGYALVSKAPNDGGTLGLDLDIEGAGNIYAAVRHGNTLYVGGDFTTVGGQPRNRLAAIDLTTNTVTDWVAPAPNNLVYHLELDTGVSPPRLVVFGGFTLMGATARGYVASLSTVDGSLTSWAPSLSSNAGMHGVDIDVTGRSLFVAHNTSVPAGRTVARVDLDTGAVSNFADTRADHSSVVVAADPAHRRVYVGGTRLQVTTVAPVYTAQTAVITAFDMDTGAQLWRSTSDTGTAGNIGRGVIGLAVDPTRGQLVLTGTFASWGGASRGCVAVLDASTGGVTGWNPFPACFGSSRSAVAVSGDRLWVGDVWTNVGGAVQGGVAAFDLSTQTVLAPGAMFALRPGLGTATVRTVVPLADGGVVAGGFFTTVGAVETASLARLTAAGAVVPAPVPVWRAGAGSVNAVAWQGDVVWMAGSFESVRDQQRTNLLAYDTATDTVLPSPSINGIVYALAVDGPVVYLGGLFTAVDGQARTRLAAIHATDGLTGWAPEANNQVTALAVDRAPGAPARLWIGGVFSTIRDPAGAWRTSASLAATRLDTGLVDTTIPNPGLTVNTWVRALAVHGNRLYLGGSFTTSAVGTGTSTVANRLASLDRATGVLTDWRPNANGQVDALAVSPDGTVYVGGHFSLLNGEVRNRLAAIAPDGSATSWNPNLPLANQRASAMALAGAQVWVGGAFTQVGSTPVAYLAAVDPTTQQAIASGPRVNNTVNAVAFDASGTRMAVGGVFTQADGVNRAGAVVARMVSGGLAPRGRFVDVTGPIASGAATIAFARHGGVLYAGGSFTHVGGRRRRGLAAIDLRSNALLPWNPDPSGTVNALVVDASGGTAQLIVGGAFTTIAGVPRNGLAAFPLAPTPSSVATSMVVTPPGTTVTALLVDPQRRLLYAGDNFGWVRSVELSTGAAGTWSTSTAQPIGALALDPIRRIVYVGGSFGSFLGVARTRLAAFDADTGNVLPWNPGADGIVSALAVSPQTGAVFAGGSFVAVAGQTRNRIAHLSSAAGGAAATLASPLGAVGANSTVTALAVSDAADAVIVGGGFTTFEGQPRSRIAAASLTDGTLDDWNPGADSTVNVIAGTEAGSNAVLLGGAFRTVGGLPRPALVVFGTLSPPQYLTAPPLTGTAREGQVLTVGNGTWSNDPSTFLYRWERCDDSGCTAIDGATTTTYQLTAADVERRIRAVVTALNTDGESDPAPSALTDPVAPLPPANQTPPSFPHAVQVGVTLVADPGSWASATAVAYGYQWQRCTTTAAASCEDIVGATGDAYAPVPADHTQRLRVVVTASNWGGVGTPAASTVSEPVLSDPPSRTAAPVVVGEPRYPVMLTVTPADWTAAQAPAVTRQWQRCATSDAFSCSPIAGATGTSRTISAEDVGRRLRVVETATNDAGSVTAASEMTSVVAPDAPVSATPPWIAGTAQVGGVLTADPGGWSTVGAPDFGYRWQRCTAADACVDIPGATGSTHTLGVDDLGLPVRVVVTATNAGGSGTAASLVTGPVVADTPVNAVAPWISGEPRFDLVLTAEPGSWATVESPTYAWQWRRCTLAGSCTTIPGATQRTYRPVAADVGMLLEVVVTATNSGGPQSATSHRTGFVLPDAPQAMQPPTVPGQPSYGVPTTATEPVFASVAPVTVAYQWQRCATTDLSTCVDIPGANDRDLAPAVADVRTFLRLVATGTNAGGTAVSVSGLSLVVLPDAPVSAAPPGIAGDPRFPVTLTADDGAWATVQAPVVTHRWFRCDAGGGSCVTIPGATDATHTVVAADVGRRLRVVATATNDAGSATSSAMTPVVLSDRPNPDSAILFDGPAVWNRTVTVIVPGFDAVDDDITTTLTWQRCTSTDDAAPSTGCTDIPGAVDLPVTPAADAKATATRTVDDDDVGTRLRVVVRAGNSGGTTVLTAETNRVAVPVPVTTEPVPILGATRVQAELVADPGTWDFEPLSLAFQWLRCPVTPAPASGGATPTGDSCVPIAGAVTPAYTPSREDVGHRLVVQVTAANEWGTSTQLTSPTDVILPPPPVALAEPTLSGLPVHPATLTVDPGQWEWDPTLSIGWHRCPTADADVTVPDSGCVVLGDGLTHATTPEEVGQYVHVRLVASNTGGDTIRTVVVGPITAPPPASPSRPVVTGGDAAPLATADEAAAPAPPVESPVDDLPAALEFGDAAPSGFVVEQQRLVDTLGEPGREDSGRRAIGVLALTAGTVLAGLAVGAQLTGRLRSPLRPRAR